MAVGMTGKFSILQQSPLDFEAESPTSLQDKPNRERWVPSRYNVRATATDGRLILWNSYTGTMSVFPAAQRNNIEVLLTKKGFDAGAEGVVKYLFDRGFLVKAGTDEYRRVQVGFGLQHYRSDVLELILLASEDCNFRCEYCYEDFARGTMKPSVRASVKRLVERRLGGLKKLSIQWFGGEPLYGFAAIEDLAPFFVQVAQENSIRLVSSMTTNGYLLTPQVADKLLTWGINSYQITLDGRPEEHNKSRPARDGQGTFETIFENLKAFRARSEPFFVDLRVNFDQRNAPHLHEFLGLVEKEFGGDSRFQLRFRAVGKWGGANDGNLAVCGTDEAADIQRELKIEARKRNLQISDDIRQVSGMGAHVCYAARPYNFIVGASGKLMKCTIDLDKQDRNVVGYLSEDGEPKLDFDKFALWTEPAFQRDPKCQKCVVVPVCQGVHCPLIRIESGESPCTSLRMNAKKELVATVERYSNESRTRIVDNRTNAAETLAAS